MTTHISPRYAANPAGLDIPRRISCHHLRYCTICKKNERPVHHITRLAKMYIDPNFFLWSSLLTCLEYKLYTRDRKITHNVANISSVDQILDFNIICDLNLSKTLPPPPPPPSFFSFFLSLLVFFPCFLSLFSFFLLSFSLSFFPSFFLSFMHSLFSIPIVNSPVRLSFLSLALGFIEK